MTMIARRILLGAGIPLALPGTLRAQGSYPDRPIRLIVSFSAGGFNDILARFMAQGATTTLGQPVVVENRPGGAGMLGSELVARAPADGYVLLMASVPHVVSPLMSARPAYDPIRDFAGITLAAEVPNVLVVHPSLPARTLPELIALIRANPGQYSYASNSVGGSSHLGMELFKLRTGGLDITHVPYRGSAPAMADLLAGRVQMTIDNLNFQLPSIQEGKLRAIAVTTLERVPELPDVPTASEAGLPGFVAGPWFGVLAPAGTPAPVVARLNEVFTQALRAPEVAARLPGARIIAAKPAETMRFMAEEQARWAEVVRAANIRIE
jgi:tripartite-type tricarboxylate transporter receptor subunit TctC